MPTNRLLAVDAARGAAAAAVVLFHSLNHLPQADLHPALAALRTLAVHGWLGVHVFFALSGWCIAERTAAAVRRNESSRVFLLERFLRIYPTYWAALLFAIVLRLSAIPINHTSIAANLPASPLAWLGDLTLLHPALGTPGYLLVSWTLFYELGFYAAACAALMMCRLRVPPSWLLLLGALLCLWPSLSWQPRALMPLGLWREFYIGAIAWWAARRSVDATFWVSLALFIATVFLSPGGLRDAGVLIAVVTATIIYVCARRPVTVPPVLLVRLAAMGAFSYSLYLIHVPVLSPLLNFTGHKFSAASAAFCVAWLMTITFTFFAGWLFYRLVEGPCERWRRRHYSSRPATTPL